MKSLPNCQRTKIVAVNNQPLGANCHQRLTQYIGSPGSVKQRKTKNRRIRKWAAFTAFSWQFGENRTAARPFCGRRPRDFFRTGDSFRRVRFDFSVQRGFESSEFAPVEGPRERPMPISQPRISHSRPRNLNQRARVCPSHRSAFNLWVEDASQRRTTRISAVFRRIHV
jgi:hypothetical protein